MKRALSFLSGLMLALLAVLFSVAGPALQTARFERAVLDTVNGQAVGMSESDLTAFARETMSYLRGEQDAWAPATPFAIPQSVADHMAEVRGWVAMLTIVLPLGALAAAAGLSFVRSFRAARNALLCMLALLAAVLLWAVVDFNSLWVVIHRVLMPGGIFPAGVKVMQLLPVSLFFGYLGSVTVRLMIYLAGMFAGVWFLSSKQRHSCA